MNAFLLQLAIYLVVLLVLAKPLGTYMARVFGDAPSRAHWLGPIERAFYRLAGVNTKAEMGWKRYALAVIVVNVLGALAAAGT